MTLLPEGWLTAGVAGILLYFIASSAWSWYRLRQFPGPFFAAFSYLWLASIDVSGAAWKTQMRVRAKYKSPLIRIGPNLLITDDPDILRRMSSARSKYGRGGWYEAFRIDATNPSMFGTTDTEWHDDIKAKASFGYSGREIPTLERDVDGQIASLKKAICSKYISDEKTTRPMDFAATAQYFALDTISTIGLGKAFGYLEADSDVTGYIQAMNVFSPMSSLLADVPFMRNLFLNDFLFSKIGPKPTDPHGPGRIMGMAKETVAARFENGGCLKDHPDMLGSFLRHGITRHQAEAEVTLQIIAGTDMTSNVIRSTMLYISTSPRIYTRLQSEIDTAVSSGDASTPVTFAQTKSLPYLQSVIYESLRLHPPTFALASKRVPPEGDTLHGKFIPGGTEIAQNSWSLLRNTDIFGEDVESFRPERFLLAEDAKRVEMERTVGMLFGYGRWICPGKMIAFMEISKVVFELLREFDWQIVDPAVPWDRRQYSVFMFRDMWMRVAERGVGEGKGPGDVGE
ncbi:cytochrome P450 [Podospora aff. communis PSN243]|uniref:Cytochrome P450 n=1 Tax=Podospora aff. communis PSN243 TaxID=3040156 RepID=A0AAV9G5G4_9PEZI|nr:cytochrome P450 [Podospora aff. communis PSN243]